MTIAAYSAYRQLLIQYHLKHTQRPDTVMPQNWVRVTDEPSEVQRIFLGVDGSFKAYRGDGNLTCHGSAAWELAGCFA